MDEYESLSHSKWERKYHVVSIPKCRAAACRPTDRGRLRAGHAMSDTDKVRSGRVFRLNVLFEIVQNCLPAAALLFDRMR
jgi:hypothetical protein